jgi:hypothetical protein
VETQKEDMGNKAQAEASPAKKWLSFLRRRARRSTRPLPRSPECASLFKDANKFAHLDSPLLT